MQSSQPSRSRLARLPRPQYSLRVLVLLVTLFAIGFPIWYRWPYEITEPPDGGPSTRTTTWQRQWGGGKLKHGPMINKQGPMTLTSVYRNDLLHGPYVVKVRDRYVQRGQYVNGLREGDWIEGDGDFATTLPLEQGQMHGFVTFKNNRGHSLTAHFDHGRITQVNGKPWSGSLDDTLKNREIDDKVASELKRSTDTDVVEMPLKDTILYLSEKHNIPIVIDPKTIAKPDVPLTACLRGIDLQSTLAILLGLHDLACDYRYGCLWVTTPEDAATWTERTGVSAMKPSPGSDVARAWNEPVKIDVRQLSLQESLDYTSRYLALSIDTSAVPSAADAGRRAVTLHLSGLPFRHVLGQMLYQTNCRCQLDGDKLVILPAE